MTNAAPRIETRKCFRCHGRRHDEQPPSSTRDAIRLPEDHGTELCDEDELVARRAQLIAMGDPARP